MSSNNEKKSTSAWNAVQSLLPFCSEAHETLGELLSSLNKDLEVLTKAEAEVEGTKDSRLSKKLSESNESVRRYTTLIGKVQSKLKDFKSEEMENRQELRQEIIDLLRDCKLEHEKMNKCLDDVVSCAVELRKECKVRSQSCETKRSEAYAKLWSLASKFFVCCIVDAGLYHWANRTTSTTAVVAAAATVSTAVKDSACALVTSATGFTAILLPFTAVTTLPVNYKVYCCLRQLSKLQTNFDEMYEFFDEEVKDQNSTRDSNMASLFDAEQQFKDMSLGANGRQVSRQDPTRSDRGHHQSSERTGTQLSSVPELFALVQAPTDDDVICLTDD